MIRGVGVDVCSIARIERVWAEFGERFEMRLLTPVEREGKIWNAGALARRWALKESVAKALGTGIGAEVGFQDITVAYTPEGAPIVAVRGYEALRVLASTSDDMEAGVATAFCVIEDSGEAMK